ncbi:hypothetical protein GEMRC1_001304 [Eukaryota sp. GEM-RC1]
MYSLHLELTSTFVERLFVQSCLSPESLLFLNLFLTSLSLPLVHITPLPLFGHRTGLILSSPYFSFTKVQLQRTKVRNSRSCVFMFLLVPPSPLALPQRLLLAELHQHLLNITSSSTYSDFSSSSS